MGAAERVDGGCDQDLPFRGAGNEIRPAGRRIRAASLRASKHCCHVSGTSSPEAFLEVESQVIVLTARRDAALRLHIGL